MKNEFYTILTDAGLEALANATTSSTRVEFSKIAVGDGNGAYYTPTRDMTALKGQKWVGNTTKVNIDPNNPNWVLIEGVIPSDQGGFYIREVGLLDNNNVLLALGILPETYKPDSDSGSIKDLFLKVILEVSNTDGISLQIDPTIVMANKKYVDDQVDVVTQQLAQIPKFTRGIKLIAHAGANQQAPESSIPAFNIAGKAGRKYCETDFHVTSDGHWVCMHDTTVDRTTNGTGLVAEKTFAQILALTLDNGANIAKYPNLKVPTIDDFLRICIQYDMTPIIEYKPYGVNEEHVDALIEILSKYNLIDSAHVISFNANFLHLLRVKNNRIITQLLGDANTSTFNFAKTIKANGIGCQHTTLTKAFVEHCHDNGLFVNAWTVDDFDRALTLSSWGVDFISTNKIINVKNSGVV